MGDIAELYRVLGVEQPAPMNEGENEQEAADPAKTGENEQEVADPAANEMEQKPETETETKPERVEQTKEENARNAQRRRQAVIDEEVRKALETEREKNAEEWKAFFKRANMTDPATGNPIETLEQFDQWHRSAQMESAQKNLRAGKLTPENMEQLIENSPTMLRAKKQLDQAEEAARLANAERHQQLLKNELDEIKKINPKINSLTDILAMETGAQWAKFVNENGLSYVQAYKLANQENLLEQSRRVAQADAQIRSRGKEHLKPDAVRGQTAPEVPRKVREMYKLFRPDLTDEQIQKDYMKRSAE